MRFNKEELIEKVNQYQWYHNIDLGNGVVTPGRDWHFIWNPSAKFMEREDFKERNVLEIGTWDGFFSFKAESMGAAKVIATDIKAWETFQLAREILDSKVEFKIASIYSLDVIFEENSFDIVICYGIYYHLLHPILGFIKINKVLRPGGTLFLEGAYYRKYQDSLCFFSYGEDSLAPDDPTFCTCPTLKCLQNMLHASLFEVVEEYPYYEDGGIDNPGRVLILAKKRNQDDSDLLYEHTYPESIILQKKDL